MDDIRSGDLLKAQRRRKKRKSHRICKTVSILGISNLILLSVRLHLSAGVKMQYKSDKDASEPKQMIQMIDDG